MSMYVGLWLVQVGLANGFMLQSVPFDAGRVRFNILGFLLVVIGLVSSVRYAGLLSACRTALSNR